MDLHARRLEPAGADGDAVSLVLHRLPEDRQLVNRRREIGVGDQHQVPPGHEDAVLDAVPLAAVSAVVKESDRDRPGLRPLPSEPLDHPGGAVPAAVVHDQDLGRLSAPEEIGLRRHQASEDPGLFIVGGNDDRESGRRLHASSSRAGAGRPGARADPGARARTRLRLRKARSARSPD